MTWAQERRLDYIDYRLCLHGEVQRGDIIRTFDVSMSQASQDVQAFLREHPKAADYDKSRKRYVPANGRYRSERGWTTRAVEAWAAAGKAKAPGVWID